jgi:hypothetical protein
MKKLLENASVNLFLIAFPVLMVMACTHVLTAIALLATLLITEMIMLKHFSENMEQKRVRASGIYSFTGIALGLNFLSLNLPPQIAIIISLCLLLVGTVQIFLQDKILWIDIWEKWDFTGKFGLAEYVFFLAVALASSLMVVANFNSQMIWLPLTSCWLATYAYVRGRVLEFSADDLDIKIISGFILVVVGIISTLIQFNEARVFGILIWVIGLIAGILLILAIMFLYFRAFMKEKKRVKAERIAEQEKQVKEEEERKDLRHLLFEKSPNLTWEEILTGFNKVYHSVGISLLLSVDLERLTELVTVSNEKKQIFWDNILSQIFDVMDKAAQTIRDDEGIKKILDACTSIEEFVNSKKTNQGIVYKGEPELKAKLERVREIIRS